MKILYLINLQGFHFRKQGKGGMYATPHPDGTFPADATFLGFDPETLTVSYYLETEEVEEPVMQTVPQLDDEGEPVVDEEGNALTVEEQVVDEEGEPVFKTVVQPIELTKVFTDADVEAAKVWTPPLDLDAVLTALRAKRNELLSESDFSQLSDAPVDSTAWAVYRQELRDLPSTVDSATGQFTWPTKPNA